MRDDRNVDRQASMDRTASHSSHGQGTVVSYLQIDLSTNPFPAIQGQGSTSVATGGSLESCCGRLSCEMLFRVRSRYCTALRDFTPRTVIHN